MSENHSEGSFMGDRHVLTALPPINQGRYGILRGRLDLHGLLAASALLYWGLTTNRTTNRPTKAISAEIRNTELTPAWMFAMFPGSAAVALL